MLSATLVPAQLPAAIPGGSKVAPGDSGEFCAELDAQIAAQAAGGEQAGESSDSQADAVPSTADGGPAALELPPAPADDFAKDDFIDGMLYRQFGNVLMGLIVDLPPPPPPPPVGEQPSAAAPVEVLVEAAPVLDAQVEAIEREAALLGAQAISEPKQEAQEAAPEAQPAEPPDETQQPEAVPVEARAPAVAPPGHVELTVFAAPVPAEQPRPTPSPIPQPEVRDRAFVETRTPAAQPDQPPASAFRLDLPVRSEAGAELRAAPVDRPVFHIEAIWRAAGAETTAEKPVLTARLQRPEAMPPAAAPAVDRAALALRRPVAEAIIVAAAPARAPEAMPPVAASAVNRAALALRRPAAEAVIAAAAPARAPHAHIDSVVFTKLFRSPDAAPAPAASIAEPALEALPPAPLRPSANAEPQPGQAPGQAVVEGMPEPPAPRQQRPPAERAAEAGAATARPAELRAASSGRQPLETSSGLPDRSPAALPVEAPRQQRPPAGRTAAGPAEIRPGSPEAQAGRAAADVRLETATLRAGAHTSQIDLLMRPEHLGRVAVRLVERAGLVQVTVRSDSQPARDWLAGSLPTLVGHLNERGFEVTRLEGAPEAGLDWWYGGNPGQRGQDAREWEDEARPRRRPSARDGARRVTFTLPA